MEWSLHFPNMSISFHWCSFISWHRSCSVVYADSSPKLLLSDLFCYYIFRIHSCLFHLCSSESPRSACLHLHRHNTSQMISATLCHVQYNGINDVIFQTWFVINVFQNKNIGTLCHTYICTWQTLSLSE